MFDSLGDRMKTDYENRTRVYLPRRTYTIIRTDGKAFHSYTKGLNRPFDLQFIEDMDNTAIELCSKIMGAKFAFVQSDEISILLTDFEGITTEAWFDNNLQKMCSVSAAIATRAFNEARLNRLGTEKMKWAEFDSRVFQIPQPIEVYNYMVWRQNDTVRNSISSVAQSLYSPKELHGKSCNEMQEMAFQKGINWNEYDDKLKRGRLIIKEEYQLSGGIMDTIRTHWISVAPPIFSQDKEWILALIPKIDE